MVKNFFLHFMVFVGVSSSLFPAGEIHPIPGYLPYISGCITVEIYPKDPPVGVSGTWHAIIAPFSGGQFDFGTAAYDATGMTAMVVTHGNYGDGVYVGAYSIFIMNDIEPAVPGSDFQFIDHIDVTCPAGRKTIFRNLPNVRQGDMQQINYMYPLCI
jgi:hypothetical protein